jgi:pyruvate,water dikinase
MDQFMKTFILSGKDCTRLLAGGKAYHLQELEKASTLVPKWFVLSTEAFVEFKNQIKKDFFSFTEKEIEELFLTTPFPENMEEQIKSAYRNLGSDAFGVSVRSSAQSEDSLTHSFAGQFSTFLHQESLEDVFCSIKKCWASLYSDRAKNYIQKDTALQLSELKMAVVIQQMIPSDVSGVLFTRDPMHPTEMDMLRVSAAYGLGEGLVSGQLEADEFVVHKSTYEVKEKIISKKVLKLIQHKGSVQAAPVEKELQDISCLSSEQLKKICELSKSLESYFKLPQDVEWAFFNNELYCLQTRPITTLPPREFEDHTLKGEQCILWDNSNITESYNGVTTPLTFSHISRAYTQVYFQYCSFMGVPQKTIKENESTFRNMLGLIRGRVYYNLGSWYRMIFLFPFAGTSKGFMETMMGVRQQLKPELASLFDFTKNPPTYRWWQVSYLLVRNVYFLLSVKKRISAFKDTFNHIYIKAFQLSFRNHSTTFGLEYYNFLLKNLLSKWQAPIISDTRCMLFFGILKKLCEKWILNNDHSGIYNDLLSAQKDLPSTEPTRLLMHMAKIIEGRGGDLKQWWLTTPVHDIQENISEKDKELHAALQTFLAKYGFRCINELKLESIDLHEDPSFVLEAVKRFLLAGKLSTAEIIAKEEETYLKALRTAKKSMNAFKWILFSWILTKARSAVKDREELRLLRTNIFGICRRIFKSIGEKYAALKIIESPMDIFYLTIDEIIAYEEGRSLMVNLQALALLRKNEFDHYKKTIQPPDRFFTKGSASLNMKFTAVLSDQDLLLKDTTELEPNMLKGTPCSPGVVEGIVRVVREVEDAQGMSHEILVAERTDPGWVPIFPSCSALLIERGSLLSHSAIVARELGIPTIVGITGLMKKLKTGMRVRLDAAKGSITILEQE